MDNTINFLVRAHCATYNHSAYITDALNGFVMQKTNFPFVCTIVDDASTDGEQEVIKEYVQEHFDLQDTSVAYDKDTDYGHVTFAQHKTNKNCFFAVIYLRENHYSQKKSKAPYLTEWMDTEYIALCEGDDYWTDPNKLQKQVDFMEGHPEYSMCFHKAKVLNECGTKEYADYSNIKNIDYSANDIFDSWIVPTASVVYNQEMVKKFQVKRSSWFVYGDIVLFEKCAHVGKIRGFADEMSVYRMNENSLVHNPIYQNKRILELPYHYRALKINFNLIDKVILRRKISDSYYAKMRNENGFFNKLFDFFRFVAFHPCYAYKKIFMKLKK